MIFTELIVDIAASAILLLFGFLFGKFRERKMQAGKNLDDYEFYPFDLDEKKNLFFDVKKIEMYDEIREMDTTRKTYR